MVKVISTLIIVVISLNLSSCGEEGGANLTCSQIISAYESAGYTDIYHSHSTSGNPNSYRECYIVVYENDTEESDLAEIVIYYTEEDAKEAAEISGYNPVLWLVSAILGEPRPLKVGQYGRIKYSSYNSRLLKPIKELTK